MGEHLAPRDHGRSRVRHLRPALSDASRTLLKPSARPGNICFGPLRDGHLTFQAPLLSPRWRGLAALESAGPRAVPAHLAGYGSPTRDDLQYWLVAGLSAGRGRLDGWLEDLLGDPVVEIQVDGQSMSQLREWTELGETKQHWFTSEHGAFPRR